MACFLFEAKNYSAICICYMFKNAHPLEKLDILDTVNDDVTKMGVKSKF